MALRTFRYSCMAAAGWFLSPFRLIWNPIGQVPFANAIADQSAMFRSFTAALDFGNCQRTSIPNDSVIMVTEKVVYMILICFLMLLSEQKKFVVSGVQKRVPVQTQDKMISAVEKVVHHDGSLYLIDVRDLDIWAFDYRRDHLFSFSGKGQGPGELQSMLTSFYVSEGKLKVHHANPLFAIRFQNRKISGPGDR